MANDPVVQFTMRYWWAIVVLAALGAFGWVTYEQEEPSGALTPAEVAQVRKLAVTSNEYHQNRLHPGCGVEREAANEASDKLRQRLRQDPRLLVRLIGDPDKNVRAAVVLESGWSTDHRPAKTLAKAFPKEKDPVIREYLVGAIGSLGGPEAVRTLRSAIGDPSLDVQYMALAGLLHLRQHVDRATRSRIEKAGRKNGRVHLLWQMSSFEVED